jgi:hypothetical protein
MLAGGESSLVVRELCNSRWVPQKKILALAHGTRVSRSLKRIGHTCHQTDFREFLGG